MIMYQLEGEREMACLFSLLASSSSVFFFPSKSPKAQPAIHSRRPSPSLINCLCSSELTPPPPVQTFWKWLSDEGIVSEKTPVKPSVVPEGFGLVAQRDMARNEVVLQVPNRFWINPDVVAASEIGTVCGGLKPWVSVALFLIREKLRDESTWGCYLDILPEHTNSTIYWWVWIQLAFYLFWVELRHSSAMDFM